MKIYLWYNVYVIKKDTERSQNDNQPPMKKVIDTDF